MDLKSEAPNFKMATMTLFVCLVQRFLPYYLKKKLLIMKHKLQRGWVQRKNTKILCGRIQ